MKSKQQNTLFILETKLRQYLNHKLASNLPVFVCVAWDIKRRLAIAYTYCDCATSNCWDESLFGAHRIIFVNIVFDCSSDCALVELSPQASSPNWSQCFCFICDTLGAYVRAYFKLESKCDRNTVSHYLNV